MQRAINVKTKTGLKSCTIIWDLNARCLRVHHLFHNIFSKMQTQNSNSKNSSCSEKPKLKDPKPALSYDNAAAELAKKEDKKNKKKKFRRQRQEHIGERKKQILVINVNITKTILKKKPKIRCFYYNKKSYYAYNCIELLKN